MDFFKSQFQLSMFLLEHEEVSDFYLSPCQSSESPLPLLILRPILFFTAISAMLYSQVSYIIDDYFNVWFIYLSHWGLMTVIFTSAFAVIVSLIAQIADKGSAQTESVAWSGGEDQFRVAMGTNSGARANGHGPPPPLSVQDPEGLATTSTNLPRVPKTSLASLEGTGGREQRSQISRRSKRGEGGMAWYVKIYWVLYNIAKPLALLITLLFWTVLYERGDKIPLALCGHGTNAVVMLVLLFSSRQPSRVLHFFHPFLFGIAWALFSVIYYLAGGTNTAGKRYIYPVVDWSKPLRTVGVVAGTAMALCVFHLVVVALAALRDWLASKFSEKD